MSKFLNINKVVMMDDHCNVHLPNHLYVKNTASAKTPQLEENSCVLATTEWVKALGAAGGLAGGSGNGTSGTSGTPGSQWYVGSAAPLQSLGVNGDLFLNSITGQFYKKESGSWVSKGILKGPAGAAGAVGPVGPAGQSGPPGEAGYSPSTQELLDMVFDVQGNYYTEKIKPLAIETMLLEVGAASQNFQLVNIVFKVNPTNLTNVTSTAGKLTHLNINNEIREWTVAASNITNLAENTPYYIYIQVPRTGSTGGVVLITTDKIVWNSVTDKYTFLVGVLHSKYLNTRQISLTYGITTIAGQYITTGRISANNADTYFDLNSGEIHGKITFTSGSTGYDNIVDKPALGSLAFDDLVEIGKLGTTIIEGGYIKTSVIDTGAIRIGYNNIDNVPDLSLYAETGSLGSLAFDDLVEIGKLGSTIIQGGYIKTNIIDTGAIRISYNNLDGAPDLTKYAETLNLKALAYEDKVELAKLGETIIQGGYIKSNLLDVNAIRVSGGLATVSAVNQAKLDAIEENQTYVDTALSAIASVDYVNGIRDSLQAQVDGVVVTWFYAYAPTLANYPASDWTTVALKNQHLGDLFYDTVSGYAYRFSLTNNTTYEWILVQDTAVTEALALASLAKDTADGKRRVFTDTPTVPYDKGDLWVQGTTGDILFANKNKAVGAAYALADWTKASKYTDDTAVTTLSATLKAMAFEDKVELAKLGETIIEGGYVKTDLIDVDAIIVNGNIETVANATAYTDAALATAKDYTDAAENALKGVTDNFTTITGGLVTTNTIKLGTQLASVAGITGTGTTASSVRFWAGGTYENRATAPFRVQQDGKLYATGAVISGAITITGGSGYDNLTDKPTLGALAAKDAVDLSSTEVTGALPNASVAGLKALALKDTITRSLITDIGAMAAIDKLSTANAATYIDDSAIVTKFIAANAIIGSKILAGAITADKISVTDLSALNANIGGWKINPNNIASPADATGFSRLTLSPTSAITVKNASGQDKLVFRSGSLTPLVTTASAVSFTMASVTVAQTSVANSNTTTYGSAVSFNVASPGIYSGTITNGAFTVTTTPPAGVNWGGYITISVRYDIYSDAGLTNRIAGGTLSSASTSTPGDTLSIPSIAASVTANFTTAGTYYMQLSTQRQIYSNTIATTTIAGYTATAVASSFGQAVGTTELTDEGFQVVFSTDTYFKIERANYTSGSFVNIGGAMTLTGDLTANASDKRLKQDVVTISDALDKVRKISGVHYTWTDEAIKLNPHLGYDMQVGVLAQEVQAVLPEVVKPAPFDVDLDTKQSKTGENYLTVQYEKLVPLLIQAIKELDAKIQQLENNK